MNGKFIQPSAEFLSRTHLRTTLRRMAEIRLQGGFDDLGGGKFRMASLLGTQEFRGMRIECDVHWLGFHLSLPMVKLS